jgi:hypothetical protein
MDPVEVGKHLLFAALAHAPCFPLAAVKGHHQVELLAASKRIVDEMVVRPAPDRRRVPAQILRHVRAGHHGPIDDMPRYAHLVSDQLVTDDGLDAVAANERGAAIGFSVLVGDSNVLVADHEVHDLG